MPAPELTLHDTTLSGEVTVAAAPEQVLDYVADLQHMERWWPEHWRYRRLSGDGGPGTRYYWLLAVLFGITRIDVREPGRLAYHTSLLGLPIRASYQFLPSPSGTSVRVDMSTPGLRLGVFARSMAKQLGAALSRLPQAVLAS